MAEAEAGAVIEEEKVEKPESEVKPKSTRAEWEAKQIERASKGGWKDYDEYVAEGGDPDKWKTADAFNTYGELIGTVKRQRQEFEQRLEGVQRLSEAQLTAQRQRLEAEKEALIEEGGKTKEVKALDRQIQATFTPVIPPANPVLDEWNAENPWINEDSKDAVYAKDLFSREVRAGKTIEAAVASVDAWAKKNRTVVTHKPATVPESERGNGSRGFTKQAKTLTMSDLNDDEKLAWKHMGHAWKSEKDFLQSATDMRNAAKGGK